MPARSLEQLLLAVGDVQKPILVDPPNIAGVEPAVGFDGFAGGFRFVPVAGKDKRPPHQQFAIGSKTVFHRFDRLAHRPDAVILCVVQGQHG